MLQMCKTCNNSSSDYTWAPLNLAGLSNIVIVYSTFFTNIVPIKSLIMKAFIVHKNVFFLLIALLITGL